MAEPDSPTTAAVPNPFSGARQGFFERGDRRIHLEQLRHVSQWSRPVQLVTGPRGAGKSTLYRQLSANLESRTQAARINGALMSSEGEVLYAMVQGFGLAIAADAPLTDMREAIAAHARQQQRSQRTCACLIDDADLLDPRAMEQLVTLVRSSPLRVVLFGEVRLVAAIERPMEHLGVAWHEIRLGGLGADEVREYLIWRFQQAGHNGELPFTSSQVKDVARLSEGLPGRIDQMANVLLVKLNDAEGSLGSRFPMRHRMVLAGLLVVLVAAYLIWQPAETPERGGVSRVEHVDVPLPLPTREREALAQPVAASEPEPERELMPKPEPPVAAAPEPVTATAAPPADEVAEPQPAPAVEVAGPAVAPAVAPTEGPRDARWILAQAPERYTLQLVTLSSAERAEAFVRAQRAQSDFATYRMQRDDRTLHVVIFGAFTNRAEAEAAATRLPEGVGNLQPWIRPFADVQAAVRTALQS